MKKYCGLIFSFFLFLMTIEVVSADEWECVYSRQSSVTNKYFNFVLLTGETGTPSGSTAYYNVTDSQLSDFPDISNMSSLSINGTGNFNYEGYQYDYQVNFPDYFFDMNFKNCPSISFSSSANTDDSVNVKVGYAGIVFPVKHKSLSKTTDNDGDSSSGTGVTVTGAYCSNPNFRKPFKLLGRVFTVIKIIIPIIIIAFGVIDFFKAMIASKDDEIKKSVKSLIMRLIAGVVIFFLPAIIHFIFKLIDDWGNYESDYSQCSICLTEPNKC